MTECSLLGEDGDAAAVEDRVQVGGLGPVGRAHEHGGRLTRTVAHEQELAAAPPGQRPLVRGLVLQLVLSSWTTTLRYNLRSLTK